MAITLLEIKMLQDVLVTLTSISARTIQTLSNLSKEHSHDAITTQTLENEISRLKGSIEAANGLVMFYDQRLKEEREKGAIQRHMEEAKVLTESIRAIRRVETSVDIPLPSRRNTSHITEQPVSFESKLSVRGDMLAELMTTEAGTENTVILQRATKYQNAIGAIKKRPTGAGNPLTSYNAGLLAGFLPLRQSRTRPSAASQEPTPAEPPSKAGTFRHTKAGEQIIQSPMELGLIRSTSMPFRRGCQPPLPMQSLIGRRPEVSHTAARSVSDSAARL